MITGIYALYWEEQDLIYIGQSQDIHSRFKEHKRKLKNTSHTNYKVQETYNLYGFPELIILEKCAIEYSNSLEVYWTKEFNSLHGANGLNIIEAGDVGYGTNSNNSKYTKLQVLLTFRYLYHTKYIPRSNIVDILSIDRSLINDIAKGASHLWLHNKYPNSYNKMIGLREYKESQSYLKFYPSVSDIPVVLSPDGIIHQVLNQHEFCITHKLSQPHLCTVLSGKRKTHKGWKLPTMMH